MERCETCGCTLFHYYGFAVAADGRYLCEQCFAEEEGGSPEPEPVQVEEVQDTPAGTCTACSGTGTTYQHRSRWIGGGKSGYRSQWSVPVTCDRCHGTGTEPEPEGPPPAGAFTYYGATITAPGFDADTFQAALNRARTRGTLPMIPAGGGVVLVESVRSGARYRVTRDTCSCPGSQSHGHCMHRAAVIAAADLYGVDVCHAHVLGFDAHGHPVTAADRARQLEGVA